MGIKDVPGIAGRIELKKESEKLSSTKKNNDSAQKNETTANVKDSVEITNARISIEKENILAAETSIENFDHAKSLLHSILNEIDEKNLLEIHGDADKIKTFLVM
jgi:hypothetical protein